MQRMLHCLTAILALFATASFAQTFPGKPVTLIVPWPAGGSTDQVMRALGTATEKYLGQSVVIENKAGAGGTLGAVALTNAKADGYISPYERDRIRAAQNAASRHIYEESHDGNRRWFRRWW